MGKLIAFPTRPLTETDAMPAGRDDPYYHFLENVMTAASAVGFTRPNTQDHALDHVYRKTRETSRLAHLLQNSR